MRTLGTSECVSCAIRCRLYSRVILYYVVSWTRDNREQTLCFVVFRCVALFRAVQPLYHMHVHVHIDLCYVPVCKAHHTHCTLHIYISICTYATQVARVCVCACVHCSEQNARKRIGALNPPYCLELETSGRVIVGVGSSASVYYSVHARAYARLEPDCVDTLQLRFCFFFFFFFFVCCIYCIKLRLSIREACPTAIESPCKSA